MYYNITPFKPTLAPEEAIRLNLERTISDIDIVKPIYHAYIEYEKKAKTNQSFEMYILMLLSTCWNAGRIEGIRMERAKRKNRKN